MYYRNDSGLVEPSVKTVPNVGIDFAGGPGADVNTDSNGAYSLGIVYGNVTVKTVPKFGSASASDANGAITSYDSMLIARHSVSLLSLSGNQQLAGDASGNGGLSAYDSGLVAQLAAQTVSHLPVAMTKHSDWQFLRCDGYPVCTFPTYAFTPVTGTQTADFYGILFGDVSGDWQSAPAPSLLASPAGDGETETDARVRDQLAAARLATAGSSVMPQRLGAASVFVETRKAQGGGSTLETFFVSADNAAGILGLDLTLEYDPSRLSIVDVQAVDQASGYAAIWHDSVGTLQIAFYGYAPMRTGGRLVRITVQPTAHRFILPMLTRANANEGAIPTRLINTSFAQSTGGGYGPDADTNVGAVASDLPKAAQPAPTPSTPSVGVTGTARGAAPAPSVPATRPSVTRTGALANPVERAAAPVVAKTRHSVFVSAKDATGVQDLDLTLDYDPSKLSIVDVKAAGLGRGNEATWEDTRGALQISFHAGAPLGGGERIVEVVVESADGHPVVTPKVTRARGNERDLPSTGVAPSVTTSIDEGDAKN
jgi:hypothetical protein